MFVTPPAKKLGDSLLWNPYEAADEAAKIPPLNGDVSHTNCAILSGKVFCYQETLEW